MECRVEVLQRIVDVLVRALHRGQSAGVLAGKGFGTRPKDRDEEIFADQRAERDVPCAHHLRNYPGRPFDFGQAFEPLRIERQQPLADRLVKRSGLGAIVKNIQPRIFSLGSVSFTFDLELANKRRDRLNLTRKSKAF